MDGYLMKRGEKGLGVLGWKKRYFIQQGSNLQFFKDKDSIYNTEPVGEIILKDVTEVKLSSEYTGGKAWHWGFELQSPKRTYALCAETEEDMIRWMNDIVAHVKIFRGEEPVSSPQFSASEPWVKELMSSTRGALVRIKNNSNSLLTRTELKLEYSNQKWSKLPPETIRPNSTIEFGTQNHNVLSGTSGSVIYKTEDGGSLKFFWSNPLAKLALGTKATFESTSASFKLSVDTAEKSSTRNLLLKSGEMFEATFTVEGLIDKSLTFSADSSSSDAGNKTTGARTTTIRLNNATSSTLVRTEYSIVTGTWTNPPPENISAANTVTFGTTSNQKLTGTSGNIIYESANKSKNVKIFWNNPFIGESTIEVTTSDGLRVETPNSSFGTTTEFTVQLQDSASAAAEKFSYSASSKKKEEPANKRVSTYGLQAQSPDASKKSLAREPQTIGLIRNQTNLFAERRQIKKEKRAQERAKIMNRFKLVAYELNNRPVQQNSSGFMSLFKEKKAVLPTSIDYVDLESVDICPIDRTDLRKRKADKRQCGLCGGVYCPKCMKVLGIGPHDVSVCSLCYNAVNEVERLSDYKSSLNMRDNHPLVILQKTIFPKMEEINIVLSKLGEAIDKNPKDQQTKLLEKKADDLFNVFNNYFKRLSSFPAESQREQKLVGNMKRAFAEFLQEALPSFKIMKRQLSVANTPPASPKIMESTKENEPDIVPFEQLMKKEVVHKDEPAIELAYEIEDLI